MKTYHNDQNWRVTERLVKTPKKTFSLEKVEAVSLKRTFFLLAAAPSLGGIALTFLWWRYLYLGEIVFLLIASIVALVVSFQFGTLKVDTLALKDDEGGTVYGRFAHLATIRDAIELAMQERDLRDGGRVS